MMTYVGFVFFNDAVLTLMVGIGLFFSFAGAGSYAVDSYIKEKAKIKPKNETQKAKVE